MKRRKEHEIHIFENTEKEARSVGRMSERVTILNGVLSGTFRHCSDFDF